jgi:uncharacterized protein
VTEQAFASGKIKSKVKRGKKDEASKFELYVDYQEPANKIPSHRLLAMLRGEAEGLLRVGLQLDDARMLSQL